MRTCIEPDAIALSLQDSGKGVSDRAFAIRAAHVYGAVLPMRMPEVLVEGKCAT